MGDRGILNEGAKPGNFMVNQVSDHVFKLLMIDFAQCKFRKNFKDEEEWREWQAYHDEERAIGRVMERYLEEGFVYQQTPYSKKLSADFQRDD